MWNESGILAFKWTLFEMTMDVSCFDQPTFFGSWYADLFIILKYGILGQYEFQPYFWNTKVLALLLAGTEKDCRKAFQNCLPYPWSWLAYVWFKMALRLTPHRGTPYEAGLFILVDILPWGCFAPRVSWSSWAPVAVDQCRVGSERLLSSGYRSGSRAHLGVGARRSIFWE